MTAKTPEGIRHLFSLEKDRLSKLLFIYRLYVTSSDEELGLDLSNRRLRFGLCNFVLSAAREFGRPGDCFFLEDFQASLFKRAGLKGSYFFASPADYKNRVKLGTQSECPNRRAWVAHILAGKPAEEFKLTFEVK